MKNINFVTRRIALLLSVTSLCFVIFFLTVFFFANVSYPVLKTGIDQKAPQKDYVAIFAHGLGDNATQHQFYKPFVGCPVIGVEGPENDKSKYGAQAGYARSCLAQESDMQVVAQTMKQHPNKRFILLGISKGASTIINTVGMLAEQNSELLKKTDAIILESPFANPESAVSHFIGPLASGYHLNPFLIKLLFPNYDPDGITPHKSIQKQWKSVDKDVPIIFIHSQTDTIVPISDSRKLYMELKKNGFNNVYIIEPKDGLHGSTLWGPYQDQITKGLTLIYEKHRLPLPQNNSDKKSQKLLTQANQQDNDYKLEDFQPSVEAVIKKNALNTGVSPIPSSTIQT